MSTYETKTINTGKYQTFYCEGGESNLETILEEKSLSLQNEA